MKTPAIAFIALLTLTLSTTAQQPRMRGAATPSVVVPVPLKLDPEFNGLQIVDVVDYLREAEPLSTSLSQKASPTLRPPLLAKELNYHELTQALEIATEGRVQFKIVNERMIHIKEGEFRNQRVVPVMRVFNLSRLLADKKPGKANKTILEIHGVVEQACTLLEDARGSSGIGRDPGRNIRSKSQFHPGTKLLIIAGCPDYVQTYEGVVLESQSDSRRPANPFGSYRTYRGTSSRGMGEVGYGSMGGGDIGADFDAFSGDAGYGGGDSGDPIGGTAGNVRSSRTNSSSRTSGIGSKRVRTPPAGAPPPPEGGQSEKVALKPPPVASGIADVSSSLSKADAPATKPWPGKRCRTRWCARRKTSADSTQRTPSGAGSPSSPVRQPATPAASSPATEACWPDSWNAFAPTTRLRRPSRIPSRCSTPFSTAPFSTAPC